EIAAASGVGIAYEERKLPVPPEVQAACDIMGLDPVYIANEGKLVAIVPPAEVEAVLAAMQAHPLGAGATIIGQITDQHPGVVVAKTGIGGSRVVDMQVGEQLPRIC
ncbi:MAG: AIR synthase-related protein, partial [Anaerolineae bacterium]